MKPVRLALVILLFVTILLPSVSLGYDYFMFDVEMNKILYMGTADNAFAEKLEMDKTPDLMMPTNDPNRFLAIMAPEEKGKTKKDKNKQDRPGQLLLFNITTGRTEDLVELGFAPFNWTYTQDHKHFFVSYKTSPTATDFELLHYDIAAMKTEKLPSIARQVNQLVLSFDEKKLYLLSGSGIQPVEKGKTAPTEPGINQGKVLTITYGPLAIENTLVEGNNPWILFAVSPERVLLIDAEPERKQQKAKQGIVRYINTLDNTILNEFKFDGPYNVYHQWYKDDKVLIVTVDGAKKDSRLYKVNATGIQSNEIPNTWIDYDYYADKDATYLLTQKDLRVINYKDGSIKECKTGGYNFYSASSGAVIPYNFYRLPESDLAVVYCMYGGKVKFFDMSQNTLIKEVSYGRAGVKFGQFMASLILNVALNSGAYYYQYYNFFGYTELGVATNPDRSRFYILNTVTKDITVYDNKYERLKYIIPEEAPLGMYLIKKPTVQTLLTTRKKIYKLDYDKMILIPIHEFKDEVTDTFLMEEDNRVIILTTREMLVLDPATLEIKSKLFLFGDPDQKYTKLKQGEQRYLYIPTL